MVATHFAAPEQPWAPTTFEQRGAAVAFTSPALSGARLRIGKNRARELVVPHPGGARGQYVLGLADISGAYSPTVFDMLVLDAIGQLTRASPADVREAGRGVALSGLAGREVQVAAQQADLRETQNRALTRSLLLRLLARQTAGTDLATDLETQGRAVLLRMAVSLGCPIERLSALFDELVVVYATMGLDEQCQQPLCQTTLGLMDRLTAALSGESRWVAGDADLDAGIVATAARATSAFARQSRQQAAKMAENLPPLLTSMATDPQAADSAWRNLRRTEWLLDGWGQMGMVFQLASEQGTVREVLAELALITPVLPSEIGEWAGVAVPPRPTRRLQRWFDAWRTGSAVFELVARNERLRTLMP